MLKDYCWEMNQNSETFNCIKPPRALWTWQWVTRYNPILLTIQLTELCIFKFLKLPLPSPGLFVFINKLVKSGKFTENECCEAILSFPLHIWIWLQTETKNKTPVPWHIVTGEHCSQLQNHGSTQKTLWQNKRMHDDTLCHYYSVQFHAHWALKQVLSIVQPFDARGTFSGFCLPIGLSWMSGNPVGELNTLHD